MKGAWIATIILLTCSVSFGDYVSEWVSHQRVDERECCELRAEQPVWENERNLPGQLPDCHELYPWQEQPDLEFDHHSDYTRELPDIEFDHHSDITREQPDLEFDGGSNGIARPNDELSAPETEEVARGEPVSEVSQTRHPVQANQPAQARKPGQSGSPGELDGESNETTPRLSTSRSEEASCPRPVNEAVGSPNLSRSKPQGVLDGQASGVARPHDELSAPETEEVARGAPANGVGQARYLAQSNSPAQSNHPAQANQLVQARKPGQSRPPGELDGESNETTPRLSTSRSEEASCPRPVNEAVGSPNLSRGKPPVVQDGGDEAKSLPPKLAW